MIIKVLAENTSVSDDFKTEHGLSLYIETGEYKLLFDIGASDLFLKNAKTLNVNIEEIDFAVISHGHYDHGGGLKHFLRKNTAAPVYVHQKAFEKHYARRSDGSLGDIGLDDKLKNNKRIVLTGSRFFIRKGIEVFSNVEGRDMYSTTNRFYYQKKKPEFQRIYLCMSRISSSGKTVK